MHGRPGPTTSPAFLVGGGATGALIAAHDWSGTPLGCIEDWPQSLKTITAFRLRSPVPLVLLWGEDGVMLYNDAYSVFAAGGIRSCSARTCVKAGPRSPTSMTTS